MYLSAGAIERLAAKLDALFPSVTVEPHPGGIDDGSRFYGDGRRKPDFVEEDDQGWGRQ
jgi:hypothetical protein